MLPRLSVRCADCDCAPGVPICGGQAHPELCAAGLATFRRGRSLYYSSLIGWPTATAHEAPLEPRPEALPARRAIDRTKPNVPLGTRLGGEDCVPCRQKAQPG